MTEIFNAWIAARPEAQRAVTIGVYGFADEQEPTRSTSWFAEASEQAGKIIIASYVMPTQHEAATRLAEALA